MSITPQPLLTIDDGESAWLAATLGLGIAMAPLWLAADALQAGEMAEVLRDWRCEATQVSLVRRSRRHPEHPVEAVISFLRANAPMLPAALL